MNAAVARLAGSDEAGKAEGEDAGGLHLDV